jgi:hypothetical protein
VHFLCLWWLGVPTWQFDADGTEISARPKLFLGREALGRDDLVLKRPMKHGIVQDWDAVEWLWDHAFAEELNVNPEEYYVSKIFCLFFHSKFCCCCCFCLHISTRAFSLV